MSKRLVLAALAASALMTGQAKAAQIYFQDFSGGLNANEQVGGNFSAANGSVGHKGAYKNNEYSFYQVRLDLTEVADAMLRFDFNIESEWTYDVLNLVAVNSDTFPLGPVLYPTDGGLYYTTSGRAKTLLGPQGMSGKASGVASFDLSSLYGQVVDIRFQFASDYAAIGAGVDIDNIRVTGSLPSAVPEPATWAMMITGFGLAGTAIRRRRPAGLPA